MVRFRGRRKDVRAEIRPRARARARKRRRYREGTTSIACTSVRAHMYVHARVSEREVSGKEMARRKRKKGKDPRIRVCARAGDIERNLKQKEKGTSRIKEKEKRESERERAQRRKSSFVVHVCHTYVCTLNERDRRGRNERDETSSA